MLSAELTMAGKILKKTSLNDVSEGSCPLNRGNICYSHRGVIHCSFHYNLILMVVDIIQGEPRIKLTRAKNATLTKSG